MFLGVLLSEKYSVRLYHLRPILVRICRPEKLKIKEHAHWPYRQVTETPPNAGKVISTFILRGFNSDGTDHRRKVAYRFPQVLFTKTFSQLETVFFIFSSLSWPLQVMFNCSSDTAEHSLYD